MIVRQRNEKARTVDTVLFSIRPPIDDLVLQNPRNVLRRQDEPSPSRNTTINSLISKTLLSTMADGEDAKRHQPREIAPESEQVCHVTSFVAAVLQRPWQLILTTTIRQLFPLSPSSLSKLKPLKSAMRAGHLEDPRSRDFEIQSRSRRPPVHRTHRSYKPLEQLYQEARTDWAWLFPHLSEEEREGLHAASVIPYNNENQQEKDRLARRRKREAAAAAAANTDNENDDDDDNNSNDDDNSDNDYKDEFNTNANGGNTGTGNGQQGTTSTGNGQQGTASTDNAQRGTASTNNGQQGTAKPRQGRKVSFTAHDRGNGAKGSSNGQQQGASNTNNGQQQGASTGGALVSTRFLMSCLYKP